MQSYAGKQPGRLTWKAYPWTVPIVQRAGISIIVKAGGRPIKFRRRSKVEGTDGDLYRTNVTVGRR